MFKNYNLILFITLFFFTNSTNIFGQHEIFGKVVDSKNDKLEFVNIGIPLKNIGTVSNQNGLFELKISDENLNDSIVFSILGYTKKSFPIKNLIETDSLIVTLQEMAYNIEEVNVFADNYKSKKYGNDFRNPAYTAGFDFDMLGYEIGVVMKNNKNGIIETVGVNIAECLHDTLFLRLNIYNFKNGEISYPLLKKPYYIKISNDSLKTQEGILNFSLREYNIKVSGNFFVSIEMIVDYPDNEGLGFYDSMFSTSATYTRFTSHGKWEKGPFNVSINSTVIHEK